MFGWVECLLDVTGEWASGVEQRSMYVLVLMELVAVRVRPLFPLWLDLEVEKVHQLVGITARAQVHEILQHGNQNILTVFILML